MKVSCFGKCCFQAKCNVGPILSWRLTQQNGRKHFYLDVLTDSHYNHNIKHFYLHSKIHINITTSPLHHHNMTTNQNHHHPNHPFSSRPDWSSIQQILHRNIIKSKYIPIVFNQLVMNPPDIHYTACFLQCGDFPSLSLTFLQRC